MFQIIDPTTSAGWDDRIGRLPGASFFHGSAWARVLKGAYGYCPQYFVIEEEGRLGAAIPLMEVKSLLTGRRGVSLPFTDYCEPLVPDRDSFNTLFEAVRAEGRRRNWKYIELRGGTSCLDGNPASAFFYGHTLDLTPGADRLFKTFRDSTRRNIKKAEKEGVEIRFENTLEALREFYRLNCLTRREHGLPPQPWRFFVHVREEILAKGLGIVALAGFKGNTVAANVYLHSGEKAIYKYGASDKAHQGLRANNVVMWEAVKLYAGRGFKSLCFGRTEPENDGLRQFKAGWSTDEQIINYYRYDLATQSFMGQQAAVSARAHQVLSRLPVPALKAVGGLLYRHMG